MGSGEPDDGLHIGEQRYALMGARPDQRTPNAASVADGATLALRSDVRPGRYAFDPKQSIRPRRSYGEWIGIPIVALFALWLVRDFFTNPNWEWDVVLTYLFDPLVLSGLWRTIYLTLLTGVTGTLFGLLLASMRLSRSWLYRGLAVSFIGFMRSVPALVLLLLIYFSSALFPHVGFYNPVTGAAIYEIPVNDLVTQFVAAWIGLTLLMGSHAGEIFRGGVLSVAAGQVE